MHLLAFRHVDGVASESMGLGFGSGHSTHSRLLADLGLLCRDPDP